jgi:hypothetical protein
MYSVTVKIEAIESRRRSAGILHVLTGSFLIAKGADYYHRFLHEESIVSSLPVFAVAIISIFYGLFRRRIDIFARYNFWLRLLQVITFTVFGLAMTTIGTPIDYLGLLFFAGLSILLLFSEKRVFQETTIFISQQGVQVPGTYRSHLLPWDQLTDVVVREDFITIFHVKKKYLQYQVQQDLSTLEVAKMNAFCKEQLEGLQPVTEESNGN